MRKPSEIIALAVSDKRYNPTAAGSVGVRYSYLCNLLERMMMDGEITEDERSGASVAIREALEGNHTLASMLTIRLGEFALTRQQFMHFWDQLIQKLKLQDR